MFYRPWQIKRPDCAKSAALSNSLGLPRLAADVLVSRGMDTPQAAQAVCGEGGQLSDPMLLSGMSRAVERIHRAVDDGERIVVFGDYDVDGVTATALLYTYLDAAGADVYYKLPSRADDGYGLSEDAVTKMAQKDVSLIITVDNGVSARDAVECAAQHGIDVVITDHHLPPAVLPDAAAVVDPLLPGDQSPCKTLSGAGVAFKLIAALDGCTPEEMLPFAGDLAAIGTIADIMCLRGENRTLVRAGLELLRDTERPGIAALEELCGFSGKELTAENVSFGFAPRLNAAGRMSDATAALELLLCDDPETAGQLAERLGALNEERQQTEQDILKEVFATIEADENYRSQRILVVAGKNYHPGVIGIAASRVVERYGKPAVIISVDENGEGRGSGRSIEGVSLYDAIAACEPLLIRFGGHALAAGLSVREEKIADLRTQINLWAAEHYPVLQHPALQIDAPVSLAGLTADDVRALDVLEPFGNGNPAPVFIVERAQIEAVYPLSEGKHTRIRFRQGSGILYAALFGCGPGALNYHAGDIVDAAVGLSVFEGRNGPMISARVIEMRPAGLDEEYLSGVQLYEGLACGAQLSEQDKIRICPQRADTIAVYRAVAAVPDGMPADDLRPLFARIGAQNAGKILVSLEALRELSLAELRETEFGARWCLIPAKEKKDLQSAPVFRRLEKVM